MRSISIVVCRAGFVNGPVRAPPRRCCPSARRCRRCRPSPPLPSVRMPPVRSSPRRCRPPVPHPDAPQHCHPRIPSTHRCRRCRPSAPLPPVRCSTPALTFHPRAAARPPSHSVHAPPLRERAAPPGWHPRHPHAVAVIRPRRASVYRRGMAQDGTVLPRLSIPARRHGRSTLCFCALVNYHSAVLTNARPPCYAEASAGRGRPRTPRALPGKRTGGGRSCKPRARRAPLTARRAGRERPAALPRETNRGVDVPAPPRRPAAGNEPGADSPANPAPAAPCSPRGAPEGNGSPPKTNGLRARHRTAGGKEAACSASSCPRCARWRR